MNIIILNENTKIKDWYKDAYSSDELGEEINENITFYQLFECMDNCKDVYNFLGVHDSIVRERVFEALSKVMNCDYDYIYNQWLKTE